MKRLSKNELRNIIKEELDVYNNYKFALYIWDDYQPSGAMSDFVGKFKTKEAAENYFYKTAYPNCVGEIIDMSKNIIVQNLNA